MKRFAKLAAAVLVVGGILFAAGHFMGGSVYSAWYNGALRPFRETLHIGWDDRGWHHGWAGAAREAVDDTVRDTLDDVRDAVRDAVDDAPGHHPEPAHTGSRQTGETAFADSRTKNLAFRLGRGDYTIARGADDQFTISGTGLDALTNWVDDGTWNIWYDEQHRRQGGRSVTITLPQDFRPEQVELHIGAASAALCALDADEIEVSVGAGGLTADALAADEIAVSVGAGSAKVALDGGWEQYRYDATAGMGRITANGQTLAGGLGREAAGGSGSRHLDLTCGMGSIELTTQA